SWITAAGTYSPEELEVDLYALRKLYLDRGYLDAQVGRPEVVPYGRNRIEVRIPVEEGGQYRVSSSEIAGEELFPESELAPALTVREGDIASLAALRESAQALRDYYGSRGYVRTGVDQRLDADPDQLVVRVTYEVTEGTLARIRNIHISGNQRTKDKVIRRELVVYPGEVLNSVKVRRSEQKLRNLKYFSSVYSKPQETLSPDEYDLTFELEEM
ncbi:MAG: hypothetical protein GWO24_32695, partial [Akkermansiaceae bacterium]|nr:hypothetical protein [Akkermansiaceae bacterium]